MTHQSVAHLLNRAISAGGHHHLAAIGHRLLRQHLRMPRPFRRHQHTFITDFIQLLLKKPCLVALSGGIEDQPDSHARSLRAKHKRVQRAVPYRPLILASAALTHCVALPTAADREFP